MRPRRNDALDSLRNRGTSSSVLIAQKSPKSRKTTKDITCKDKDFAAYLSQQHGSHMKEHRKGITTESKNLCRILLETKQDLPDNPSPSQDSAENAYESDHDRNEASIILEKREQVVPSAALLLKKRMKSLPASCVNSLFLNDHNSLAHGSTESLSTARTESLCYLAQTVDAIWTRSIPLIKRRPKPDYAVGIRASCFTDEQRDKLEPWLGDVKKQSVFKATNAMYFPFLTCETKSGKQGGGLIDANIQNTHSMTLAVRAVVELLRLSGRQKEVNHEILAFSISHDHSFAYIFGHYPAIDGEKVKYYCHLIEKFAFESPTGRDKFTAYQFTKNVYEIFAPLHYQRIFDAIDSIRTEPVTSNSSQASAPTVCSQTSVASVQSTPIRSLKRRRSRLDMDRSPRCVATRRRVDDGR